jgi:hypothetical protein
MAVLRSASSGRSFAPRRVSPRIDRVTSTALRPREWKL